MPATNPTDYAALPLYIYHVEVSDNGSGIVCAVPDEDTAREFGVEQAEEEGEDFYYPEKGEPWPTDKDDPKILAGKAAFKAALNVEFWGLYQGPVKLRDGQSGIELLRTCEV